MQMEDHASRFDSRGGGRLVNLGELWLAAKLSKNILLQNIPVERVATFTRMGKKAVRLVFAVSLQQFNQADTILLLRELRR